MFFSTFLDYFYKMSESSSNSNLDGKAEEDSVAINPENKELKEEKSLCFVKVSNKWNVLIDSTFCGNECLGYNSNVVCMNGIGFIQTSNETNIRYFNSKDKHGITKRAEIIAENCFNKPNEYSEISQLNYYEIKLQTEGNTWIEIGFKKANDFYVNFKLMGCSISYNYNFKYFKPPSICLKNGDVLGCGLVYPSGNINNKFPYVFFTHNGEQKGKSILIKQNYEYLHPYVDLENCSIETNFGNDLNNNSFVYNVYEHKVAEEFYNCCEDD